MECVCYSQRKLEMTKHTCTKVWLAAAVLFSVAASVPAATRMASQLRTMWMLPFKEERIRLALFATVAEFVASARSFCVDAMAVDMIKSMPFVIEVEKY